MADNRDQQDYIHQVLEAYRKTPGTTGTIRRPDRMLAAQGELEQLTLVTCDAAFQQFAVMTLW